MGDVFDSAARVAVLARHARQEEGIMYDEIVTPFVPTVTADPEPSCSIARFGRPHVWTTGAFYWPLGSSASQLYVGDDYVMCALCGQIEQEGE